MMNRMINKVMNKIINNILHFIRLFGLMIINIILITNITHKNIYANFGQSCASIPFSINDSKLQNHQLYIYNYLKDNIDVRSYAKDKCKIKNNNFTFCLKDNLTKDSNDCTNYSISLDETINITINDQINQVFIKKIPLTAKKLSDDTICMYIYSSIGLVPLFCKNIDGKIDDNTSGSSSDGDKCKKHVSCYDKSIHSQSLFNFSGITIDCLRSNLHNIFYSENKCEDDDILSVNSFVNFQKAIRNVIFVILCLYIIAYGINILSNNASFNYNEIILFIAKIIIVLYFSVGIGNDKMSNNSIRHNGLTEYALPILSNISADFAYMVFNAAGSKNLCYFDVNKYKDGYDFYALWDNLDCRLAYYLGVKSMHNKGKFLGEYQDVTKVNKYAPESLNNTEGFTIIDIMIGLLKSGYLLIFIILLIFIMIIISVTFYYITFYIICNLTLYVMIYLGPIFIPMMLFQRTKGYFQGWLRVVLSCTIQPMVVAAFLALFLSMYDKAIYDTCDFKRHDYDINDSNFSSFKLVIPNSESEKCTSSIGYKLAQFADGYGWSEKRGLFFKHNILNDVFGLSEKIILLAFYSLLFYYFIMKSSALAARITSGPNMGALAASPGLLFSSVASGLYYLGYSKQGSGESGSESGSDNDKDDSNKATDKISSGDAAASDKISTQGVASRNDTKLNSNN